MTIPYDTFIDKNYEEGWDDIRRMYRHLAGAINGSYYDRVPTVSGSGTAGSPTYTTQVGYQLRQGLLVDIWFDIEWSAIGGASGNIQLDLSYKSTKVNGNPFVSAIYGSKCWYSPNYDYLTIVLGSDSNVATIYENGAKVTAQPLTFARAGSTGAIRGHLRYIGQEYS